MTTEPLVSLEDAPGMNLLGLMVGSLLKQQTARPEIARKLPRLRGDLVVEAGLMAITLRFAEGRVVITRGAVERPAARVRGTLDAFLRVSLGGGLVRPWMTGQLKTRGSLVLLLRVLPLLRAA